MDDRIRDRIDDVLGDTDLGRWLDLWAASQGAAGKTGRRFSELVEALRLPSNLSFAALDMCCGPGDLGREIVERYPGARFDFVDRDYFLLAICRQVNKARGVPCSIFERDGWQAGWNEGLRTEYQLIAASTALHWFDVERMQELFVDFHSMLADGGQLIFREPVPVEAPEESIDSAPWQRFWSEVNSQLRCDYASNFVAILPEGRTPVGDAGLPAAQYQAMLRAADFSRVEVVLHEPPNVIIIAHK